jgi:hypothetical protein
MLPDDLEHLDKTLRDLRPRMPEDRLDRVAARAKANAGRSGAPSTTRGKDSFLRSRIAITLMLVFGFGLSSTGAGLAISGLGSSDQTAADAQYVPPPTPTVTPPGQGGTPPGQGGENPGQGNQGGGGEAPEDEVLDDGGVAGESESGGAPTTGEAEDVQEVRQAGAEGGSDELPFTGFAAIPVLVLGVALLTGGFALRRGSRD